MILQIQRLGLKTLIYLGLIEIWKKLGNLEEILLAVRKDLKATSFTIPTSTGGHAELWVKMWLDKPVLLSLVYFSPSTPLQEYEYYCDLIEDLTSQEKRSISLLGDYNLPDLFYKLY